MTSPASRSIHTASIEERYLLNRPGSTKETWHIRLNVEGSGCSYRTGDSLAVLPRNNRFAVQRALELLHVPFEEVFMDPRSLEPMSAFELLSTRYSVANLQKKALRKISEYVLNSQREDFLALLQKEDGWIQAHTLVDWLEFAAGSSGRVHIPFEELLGVLSPLLPRFYSIASSPLINKNRIDLTVTRVRFEAHNKPILGVCSNYLALDVPLLEPAVRVYVQPTTHFLFPDDPSVPVILIGAGTGIAPFRAYTQDVFARFQDSNSKQKLGNVWLFFGERNKDSDFLYESFWNEMVKLPFFKMATAFSRDSTEKVYVQHKLWEHREELLAWLDNGARIYICGDAKGMAKDVEAMLLSLFQERHKGDPLAAREMLKQLRKEGRYLRDVY